MRAFLVLVFFLVLAAAAGAGTPGFAPAVRDPGGTVRYVATSSDGKTTVRIVSLRDGHTIRARTLRGVLGIPRVSFDGTTGGLSGDGSRLVLVSWPRNVTRFVVLSTKTLRTVRAASLHGSFAYDAVSPDGSTVYLIEYLGEPSYRVRAYIVPTGTLVDRVIADKREAGVPMEGAPLTRVEAMGGAWAYTLYGRGARKAFVHALDTVNQTAICVDLPWRLDHGDRATMKLEHGRLVLRRHGVRLGAVDTRSFKIVT